MSSWISISRILPPLDTAVWLYDESTGDMWVGCRGLVDGKLTWARGDHFYYSFWWNMNSSKWDFEFITNEHDHPTHWAQLILPPSRAVGDK